VTKRMSMEGGKKKRRYSEELNYNNTGAMQQQ